MHEKITDILCPRSREGGRVVGVRDERCHEFIGSNRRVIANGHRGEWLFPILVDGDECLRGILEILLDRSNDEVQHNGREDEQRDAPEETIALALASCNTRDAVRGGVQRELTDNRTATSEFHSCIGDFGMSRADGSDWFHAQIVYLCQMNEGEWM